MARTAEVSVSSALTGAHVMALLRTCPRKSIRALLLLMLMSVLAGRISATQTPAPASATIDPALFSGLRWRSIGPARGGRSIAVAGSSARPFEYYFGATGGGVWKTVDGGVTWKPVSDKFL